MTTGIAYDAAYPNLPAILAKNPLFVCAYMDGPHGYTTADIATIHVDGRGVLCNHERAANQLLGGAAAGAQAAADAMTVARIWGVPTDGTVAIFYSVDVAVKPPPSNQYAIIGAAFDAINAAHAGRYLTGVYGQGGLIDYLMATGRIQVKGWLSGSKSYPGYNASSPNVGLVQQVGTDVASTDKDIVTDAEHLGIWWPPDHALDSAAASVIPSPAATSGGLSVADINSITAQIAALQASVNARPDQDAIYIVLKQALATHDALYNDPALTNITNIVASTQVLIADPVQGVLAQIKTLQAANAAAGGTSGLTSDQAAAITTQLEAILATIKEPRTLTGTFTEGATA